MKNKTNKILDIFAILFLIVFVFVCIFFICTDTNAASKKKYCYSLANNNRIIKALAYAKTCKAKIKIRNTAIVQLSNTIAKYVNQEKKRRKELKRIDLKLEELRKDKEKYSHKIRNAFLVGSISLGAIIITCTVIIIAFARHSNQVQTAPLRYHPM